MLFKSPTSEEGRFFAKDPCVIRFQGKGYMYFSKQLVEENEITQRAQARAAEINDDAMQACSRMQQDTVARLARLLEDADGGLAAQLDAVRTMRQQLQMGGGYADSDQGGYGPVEYGE